MRPRWYEAPVANLVNGRVSVSPGMWKGDDGVRATATIVSVREGGPFGKIKFGATEVPPSKTARSDRPLGFFDTDPFILDLPPGVMRIQVWRGSPTTDGNQPGAPAIYEWGFEASDYTVKPAECYITVPGVPPPSDPKPNALEIRKQILALIAPWEKANPAALSTARLAVIARIAAMSDVPWNARKDAVRRELDR